MANNRLTSLLGLARKAGKAVLGYDKIKDSGKKYRLILICSDVSDRTRRNAKLYVSETGTVEELSLTMYELGSMLGAEKVGVAAIDDDGFSESVLAAIKNQ